ncbi:hypothetical protein [Ferruginibacter sp. SUN106]|uniref:hypothetical protein n=1 Tax=Ferruginibacter sp. SUN106 TaxID=2978348 RepID=UPI003D35D6D8
MKQKKSRLSLKKKTVLAFKNNRNSLLTTTGVEYCTLSVQTLESCVTKKANQ